MAYVPLDMLEGKLQTIKAELTVVPKSYGDDSALPIFLYDMKTEGYIGLPIDWGLTRYKHLTFEDRTSKGNGILLNASKKVDPYHPKASPGQPEFIEGIKDVCSKFFTCFAVAEPRTGKTPSSLAVASYFNMRTLVLVNNHTLADQWIEEIKDKLGIPPSRIAKVAGKGTDNYTASICVGIVNTIVGQSLPAKFYSSFGTVIFDEVHSFGSQNFSKAINAFNSAITIGMTGTDERGDNAELCYRATLGPVRIVSKAKSLPLTVHVVNYTSRPLWGNNASTLKTQLAKDTNRNRWIAEILTGAYKAGRKIIILSDRIEHLEEVMQRCINLGVPEKACGLFAGQKTIKNKRVKITAEEQKHVKMNCDMMFTTYGMGKQGLDVPRLDLGIDITPAARAVQAASRVRTPMEGKNSPVWITIVDRHVPEFVGYYRKRLKDYLSINANVVEGLPKWISTL
jgi:hypothetical protein